MCKGKEPQKDIKLDDWNFLDFIQDFDISVLTETWKAEPFKFNIDGLWDYSQVRPKHKNAIIHSGGITILAK